MMTHSDFLAGKGHSWTERTGTNQGLTAKDLNRLMVLAEDALWDLDDPVLQLTRGLFANILRGDLLPTNTLELRERAKQAINALHDALPSLRPVNGRKSAETPVDIAGKVVDQVIGEFARAYDRDAAVRS